MANGGLIYFYCFCCWSFLMLFKCKGPIHAVIWCVVLSPEHHWGCPKGMNGCLHPLVRCEWVTESALLLVGGYGGFPVEGYVTMEELVLADLMLVWVECTWWRTNMIEHKARNVVWSTLVCATCVYLWHVHGNMILGHCLFRKLLSWCHSNTILQVVVPTFLSGLVNEVLLVVMKVCSDIQF